MKIKYQEWDCTLEFHRYNNKRTALILVDAITHEPVVVATVNIPEVSLEDDEVLIKDYSENRHILEPLIENGIVSTPIREVATGFVVCPVCELLIEPDYAKV